MICTRIQRLYRRRRNNGVLKFHYMFDIFLKTVVQCCIFSRIRFFISFECLKKFTLVVKCRGYAEMQRLAAHLKADPKTLSGLSGFGDLTLTCTSTQSRNYRLGLALGEGQSFDPSVTVEGAATAQAVDELAQKQGLDMPITAAVAGLLANRLDVATAMQSLLTRTLKEE